MKSEKNNDFRKAVWKIKNKQKQICFDEDKHTYVYRNGKAFTPVSTVIEKFKEPFDEKYHSERIAKKRGVSQEQVLEEWDEKRTSACEKGNRVHLEKEKMVHGLVEPGRHVMRLYEKGWKPIGTEVILFDEDSGVAGQADLIMHDSDKIIILDWKTNSKKIDRKNPYGKFFKEPFENVPDTLYGKYKLQLNFYRGLLERWGVDVGLMVIAHIYEGECNMIKVERIDDCIGRLSGFGECVKNKN